MTTFNNPLRDVASSRMFNVNGGTDNLVANGVYSVQDIVKPLLTYDPTVGDPRLFVSEGNRRSKIKWRKVNRNGWISPKRGYRNDKDTVIQVKFAKPKKMNFLAFELLRVPQVWSVKYFDHTRKRMVTLTDSNGKRITGSFFGVKVSDFANKNQAHKWTKLLYHLPTIRTNLIEIHLNREIPVFELSGGTPVSTPYSLGIRNLRIKMRIRDDGDVDDGGDDDGGPGPIGTGERAIIKRHTSTMAHDGAETSYWECAPQGAASSVVPYYMDMRQADGTESVFDTLKLVPLWPGASMSVYFSSDDTTLPWTLSANRTVLETLGNTSPEFLEGTGIRVDDSDSAYSLSNAYLRMEASKSFQVGMHFTPTFTNSGNDRWLFNFEDNDGSELGLKFDPTSSGATTFTGQFKVMQDATTVLATFTTAYVFDIDTTYAVVLGYNQNDFDATHPRGWYLSVSVVPGTSTTSTTQFVAGTAPDAFVPTLLRIGTNADMNRPMRGYVSHLWIKLDSYTQRGADAFLMSPDSFVAGEGDSEQRTNGHYKAVFSSILTKSTKVRIGPGAGYFRSKTWTPIPIDYSLAATQYQLPVTKAKYLKLEFSNLVARTYITDLEELPVTDFPVWVKDWYRALSTQRQGMPYTGLRDPGRNFYEGVPPVRTPGSARKNPRVREILEGGGGGGLPPIVYHRDQGTTDLAANPNLFDPLSTYKDLQFATTPFRFMRAGLHEYVTRYVNVERRAFFVGLKELEVFRSDYTVLMDNPEYAETYDDEQYIEDSTGWINVGGSMQAQGVGYEITSKTFESFSKFDTIQMAVLDAGWESAMSRAQIDLGDVTHLTDPQDAAFGASVSTLQTFVTGQYQGARGGNVIQLARAGVGEYGVKTETGLFDDSAITGDNPRTSAVVRIQLPQTNNGTYELRLYANDSLVVRKQIRIPIKSWQEVELAYIANTEDADWQAEVVQTDANVSEPMVVDMLGIWQNPVKWEVTNDLTEVASATPGAETIVQTEGPDIRDVEEFVRQDLPLHGDSFDQEAQSYAVIEPYEVPQPIVAHGGTIQTLSVTWFGALDISEVGITDAVAPEFLGQTLGDYLLPNSFKLTYLHRESSLILKGSTDAITAARIQTAITSLGLDATVYVAATTGTYVIAFNVPSTGFELLGVTDQSAAQVSVAMTASGGNWHPLLWPLNKPTGYFRFAEAGSSLKVRVTALKANALVSGWLVIPWYIESPMVVRAPIDLTPPWGLSDSDAMRDTTHKPLFRMWNHWFPQSYSINLYGYF